MSQKDQIIARLRAQIAALEQSDGEYSVHEFKVWGVDEDDRNFFGSALVRVEKGTWSEGSCTSETCNHNSHDPYDEGSSAFVLCRFVGTEDNPLWETPEGIVFGHLFECRRDFHSRTAFLDGDGFLVFGYSRAIALGELSAEEVFHLRAGRWNDNDNDKARIAHARELTGYSGPHSPERAEEVLRRW